MRIEQLETVTLCTEFVHFTNDIRYLPTGKSYIIYVLYTGMSGHDEGYYVMLDELTWRVIVKRLFEENPERQDIIAYRSFRPEIKLKKTITIEIGDFDTL